MTKKKKASPKAKLTPRDPLHFGPIPTPTFVEELTAGSFFRSRPFLMAQSAFWGAFVASLYFLVLR